MAGTAEGAARARRAREEKQRLREQSEQLSASDQQAATEPGGVLIEAQQSSVALLEKPGTAVNQGGQQLAENLVDAFAPEAVREVVSAMRQRKSAALRFSAACKLLDLSLLRDRKGKGGDPDSMLDRVAAALQLRARKASAETIRVEPVTPAPALQSQQAPDS
jgi:hypothetical protein